MPYAIECKYLSEALKISITINFTEDERKNISQLGDYNAPFCEQQHTMALVMSICSNSNHLISLIPQTASNFRYLFNCGTIEAMKIVFHHANGRFDWLISEHQSVNPSREAISILSEKYKRFTFVRPVGLK